MAQFNDSLNVQHLQLTHELETLVAAGRAGRWADYRRHFDALRDGLLQHMRFEEEALFPVLEQKAAAAVRELRAEHASLRRQLEMLGAAAPEQDPSGCLAEIGELGALMRSHHAAEMALDPQYATRAIPPLRLREPAAMDLRGLRPPEPIVRILQALESGGAPLRVILPHEPVPLYGLLQERGYAYAGSPRSDGGFEVLITEEVSRP